MPSRSFHGVVSTLAGVGRRFYARGWVLGTSGNFSAVLSRNPLELAISASGTSKREIASADFLRCDDRGRAIETMRVRSTSWGGRVSGTTRARSTGVDARSTSIARRMPASAAGRVNGCGKPSAETLLHIEIAKRRGAGAVLHTHSVWGTMLSDLFAPDGGLVIEQYEMLKGLKGVTSHEHREWIPILENDQDMPRLARVVAETLSRHPDAHAFLLRRHGLYTWGDSLAEAERHVEILEFLFEAIGRSRAAGHAGPHAEIGHGHRTNS